jgi:hypothetical protein
VLSVIGKVTGFVVTVQERNSKIRFDHSLIHCKAIVAKTMPGVLKNVLEVIKIVNFILQWSSNSWPLGGGNCARTRF